ncbi:lipid A export permease/ATP-binding protein MsbA [Endozoicomonas sp. (ex Bugula neritina AB1)]|nr:lipid A export permease/ATP-binding protein MsbA [Endozoicomonas sp. (ex Bugula neritina AB1)]
MSESSKASSMTTYLRLLGYVKPYMGYFFLSILGLAIVALSQPAFAKLLEYFVDALEGKQIGLVEELPWLQSVTNMWLIPGLMMLMAFVRGIGAFAGSYYLSKMSLNVVNDLRIVMFEQMIKLPNNYYDSNNSGHILSKVTYNVPQVTSAATDALRIFAREGLTVVFLLGYLFYTDVKLTLIFLCTTPIIAIVVSEISKRFRRLSRNIQYSMGDLTQVTSEIISGYREVRGFGGETYESDRFKKASIKNKEQNLKLDRTNAIQTPVLQFLTSIALSALLFAILFVGEEVSTAALVGFVTAAALMPRPIRQLSEVNAKIQKGLAAAESIFSFLDEEPEENTGTYQVDALQGKVEFINTSFTYENADDPALRNINYTIQPGQTIALVGSSGSGKTTMANLLPRFYNFSDGDILIDNISINEYELINLRSHIALVSQNITLFNGTIEENIAYGSLRETKSSDDIRLAAEAAYADEFIKKLPEGMHTIIGEDGVLLSGGQRQRLAIARAILKDAPILILDEATSALDTESERHIQAALDEAMKDRTTLVIAHRLSTIENADCILVMDQGRIVEQGAHSELLAKEGHYAKLHRLQFKDVDSDPVVLKPLQS